MLLLLLLAGVTTCSREPEPGAPAPASPPNATVRVAGERDMTALLRAIAADARENSLFTGERSARELRAELARRRETLPPRDRLRLERWLAFHELRLGDIAAAIAALEDAIALLPALPELDPREANAVRFDLAVAYMRFGESRNCVALHTSDSCILPIRGAAACTATRRARARRSAG